MTSQTSLELRNRAKALVSQLQSAHSAAISVALNPEELLLLETLKTAVDLQSRIAQICEACGKEAQS